LGANNPVTRSIRASSHDYQAWLGQYLPLLADDLALKHRYMAESAFALLRASFYRFLEQSQSQDWYNAPQVLAIGDVHVENYGTWRDSEGRLCWGINDLDEVAWLPYTLDLVRLATSALLAHNEQGLELNEDDLFTALGTGYQTGLLDHGHGFVLEENYLWLREMALSQRHDPGRFWQKLQRAPQLEAEDLPLALRQMLIEAAPSISNVTFHRRVAGLGSLGRQRVLAIGHHAGALLAREAKALAPSAVLWLQQAKQPTAANANLSLAPQLLAQASQQGSRSLDPWLQWHNQWVMRRLSPSSRRIELADLGHQQGEAQLLAAMATELAHLHRSSGQNLQDDWQNRPKNWLRQASEAMAALVKADWQDWKQS
jgi:hypothetical protein